MSMHRIYVSSSTQKFNIGVEQYGTEQDRMMQLSDRVAYWLKTQKGRFEVFRNQPGWSLEQTVEDCNQLACIAFIDNHTNAGPIEETAGDGGAEGTEAYYYGQGGRSGNSYRLTQLLYEEIASLSPGTDRGVHPDTDLYKSGLFVIQHTDPPACLIENFFHTNKAEVKDFLNDIDKYAKAEAKAIVKFMNERWEEPHTDKELSVMKLVDEMLKDGIVTDKQHWINVLMGNKSADPSFLQIAFGRAIAKIQ